MIDNECAKQVEELERLVLNVAAEHLAAATGLPADDYRYFDDADLGRHHPNGLPVVRVHAWHTTLRARIIEKLRWPAPKREGGKSYVRCPLCGIRGFTEWGLGQHLDMYGRSDYCRVMSVVARRDQAREAAIREAGR